MGDESSSQAKTSAHRTSRSLCGLGPCADYFGYSDCVVSKLHFRCKFWIYWLHIATALVVYPMFAR